MRRVIIGIGFVLGMAGCGPMYGDKSEGLHKEETKGRPVETAELPAQPPKYIDECPSANFHAPVKPLRDPDPKVTEALTAKGEKALENAAKAPTPAEAAPLVQEAVDKYSNALRRNPYDADATLKLALAYDQAYRKGCALTMLKRLASLTKHPDLQKSADASAAKINDNAGWFKAYRNEALAAAGL